jgi:peptidoglycan hydrolase CwlO-like protein
MRKLLFRVLLVFLSLCIPVAVAAQQTAPLSEPERKQLNDWMAERAALMVDSHGLEDEVSEAWANLNFSSPEIDSLRKRYRDLQHELAKAEIELRKRAALLPDVKEKARLLEGKNQQIQELTRKINDRTAPKQ